MNKTIDFNRRSIQDFDNPNIKYWRIVQTALLAIGAAIFLSLIFLPKLGIQVFWNILIPVAPALFVVAMGVWRNICPLGSFSLLPRHFGFSKSKRLTLKWQGRFHLIGVAMLFLIVPARHLWFDTNGPATALLLGAAAAAAFLCGYFFEWKSGWCSGLCPVHPVEKMYGQKVAITPANSHCSTCANCCIPCPDSTPAMSPRKHKKRQSSKIALCLLTGGLPGFIWAWFYVPDYQGSVSWEQAGLAYGLPLAGLLVSLCIFLLGQRFLNKRLLDTWSKFFAASAVACYYWFRLPALIGFGILPGDGMLVDLSDVLPAWLPLVLQISAVAFFFWWLLLRKKTETEWAVRPAFARNRRP